MSGRKAKKHPDGTCDGCVNWLTTRWVASLGMKLCGWGELYKACVMLNSLGSGPNRNKGVSAVTCWEAVRCFIFLTLYLATLNRHLTDLSQRDLLPYSTNDTSKPKPYTFFLGDRRLLSNANPSDRLCCDAKARERIFFRAASQ